MQYDKQTLINRINEGEGLFQEFKTSVEKLDRTLVAFANAKGGVVYMGVDDHGNFTNFHLTNRIHAQIRDIAKNLDPPVEVDCINLEKAAAILVKEGEEKPYKCSDGFFVRMGATNQKLGRDEILDLATKVNRIRYEAIEELDFRYPDDFSKDSFMKFVEGTQLVHSLEAMGEESFLISLGAASKQRGTLIFNHAGILFFAKDPQRWMPQAKLSYARYQGATKTHVVDRRIFGGTLIEQFDETRKKLSFDVPLRYRLADRSVREEIPHYPLKAIEEAVTNSIIHRDYYEEGAEIMVDYYSDRIEISNPGELLGNMTIEKLGHKAIRRNVIIAELFYRLRKGEKLGSGIPRMQALMNEWRLKAPVFESSGGFFSVTFFGPKSSVSEEKLLLLPARQRKFVEARNQIQEPFSASDYASFFSVSVRTAQKDLDVMLTAGIIAKEGRGKNTRYNFA